MTETLIHNVIGVELKMEPSGSFAVVTMTLTVRTPYGVDKTPAVRLFMNEADSIGEVAQKINLFNCQIGEPEPPDV